MTHNLENTISTVSRSPFTAYCLPPTAGYWIIWPWIILWSWSFHRGQLALEGKACLQISCLFLGKPGNGRASTPGKNGNRGKDVSWSHPYSTGRRKDLDTGASAGMFFRTLTSFSLPNNLFGNYPKFISDPDRGQLGKGAWKVIKYLGRVSFLR